MSVNAVTGPSLQRDLAGALRLSRATAAQPVDASAFTTGSQDASATQGSSSASQPTSTASTPAFSNDLMASLLQLQSDFSQLGLQNDVATSTASSSASNDSTLLDPADANQASTGAAPVHHHHGHHARPAASDSTDAAQTGPSAGTTEAAATSGTASTAATASAGDAGDGLHAFLQQITTAIAAYATGGPVGIAAAALTTPTKA